MPDQNPDAKQNPESQTDSAACPPSAQVPYIGQTGAGNASPASRTGGATSGVAPEANPGDASSEDESKQRES